MLLLHPPPLVVRQVEMMMPVGKVRIIVPPKPIKLFDLWGEETHNPEGRLRLRDVCQALDADSISYCDEDGSEVLVSAHDTGIWRGFSTEIFKCNQELVVICKKKKGRISLGARAHHESALGVGSRGVLLKETEGMKKVLAIRRLLQVQFDEIDRYLEKVCNLRVK